VTVTVRPISRDEHIAYVQGRQRLSFLQTPSWAGVKAEWRSESLGWFDDDVMVGAGLVLMRQVPKLDRWLAYLPEGPDLDWLGERASSGKAPTIKQLLDPMLAYFKDNGAFMVKMGPTVGVRSWTAATLKDAIATGEAKRLRDVSPDQSYAGGLEVIEQLRTSGWTQKTDTGAGFGDVQPRYVFQVPLEGRTREQVFAGFNQLWRRNVRKAEKLDVLVEEVGRERLKDFHPIYVQTAARDGFTARGLAYFERMWDAMIAEDPNRISLYLATYEGTVLAGTTMVTVGDHAWYSYGASADAGREVKPSNAIQWRMICDSIDRGSSVYDMRGISDTLDESDPLFGLIRFKLGTGGRALEYVGEWDFVLRPAIAKAFDVYMRRGEIKAKARGFIPSRGQDTDGGAGEAR